MYDENNIFSKILKSEIPCEKVYEDDEVLFFYDINPVAKIHVLGIPKMKCVDIDDFINRADETTVKFFFNKVSEVVKMLGIKESGYRLVTNTGKNGGQEVPHFHIHIIGGEKIGSKLG
tara:strand:+ start:60 stop:413 length:354 start_codon:yes stop_codon:yes gene_type:complete